MRRRIHTVQRGGHGESDARPGKHLMPRPRCLWLSPTRVAHTAETANAATADPELGQCNHPAVSLHSALSWNILEEARATYGKELYETVQL